MGSYIASRDLALNLAIMLFCCVFPQHSSLRWFALLTARAGIGVIRRHFTDFLHRAADFAAVHVAVFVDNAFWKWRLSKALRGTCSWSRVLSPCIGSLTGITPVQCSEKKG